MTKRTFSAVAVIVALATAATLVAQAQFSRDPASVFVYVFPGDKHYHLGNCPTSKGAFDRVSVFAQVRDGVPPCEVCHPERDPQIAFTLTLPELQSLLAISNERDRRVAAAKMEADRSTAAAAEAERLKEEAAAADVKRRAAALADKRHHDEIDPIQPFGVELARQAATAAKVYAGDDPLKFEGEFERTVRKTIPQYIGLAPVEVTKDIIISMSGPIWRFEATASQRVRKMDPMGIVPWTEGVVIGVNPLTIDAPDIEKIVVKRNGQPVAPLLNQLVVQDLKTRMGAKTSVHAGSVTFPASAFAPGVGVSVEVIAVPASGSNITRTFDSTQLRALR